MSDRAPSRHLASLQVFRGIAALGVVFYHAGLFCRRNFEVEFCGGVFRFGELGVDFFFVLSGFIIAMIHWKDAGQPERAPRYLKRRFFRIYPLLFVITTLKLGMMMAAPSGGGAEIDATKVVSSYLMIPPPDGAFPIVTAAWTLSHEALFYGIFLLVILLSPSVGRVILTSWGLVILGIHGAGIELHGIVGFLFDNHNLEFLVGVGLSVWLTSHPPRTAVLVGIAIGTMIAFVWGASLFEPVTGHEQVLGVRLLIGLGCAGVIALAVCSEKRGGLPPLPNWLCWLGDASYSIYLGHSMVLLLIMALLPRWIEPTLAGAHLIAFVAIAGALVATGLLWRVAENPVLTRSKAWCR